MTQLRRAALIDAAKPSFLPSFSLFSSAGAIAGLTFSSDGSLLGEADSGSFVSSIASSVYFFCSFLAACNALAARNVSFSTFTFFFSFFSGLSGFSVSF